MKIVFSFLSVAFFILFSAEKISAQNLVPNPSFEIYDSCPDGLSQLYHTTGWSTNINSADYFNSCAAFQTSVSVPSNNFGYQNPNSGNGYSGFFAYGHTNPDGNEFLGGNLITSLIIGTKYYVSFKISLGDAQPELMCGINGIGILFTNKVWGDTILQPNTLINNFAHIHSLVPYTDTLGWAIISGSFIADSSYTHFLIGHFFDSTQTVFDCLDASNINNRWSYYYIDDVCVSADSLECDLNPEGIYNLPQQQIAIYPNPATEQLIIDNGQLIIKGIEMFDLVGRKMMNDELLVNNSNHYSLNTKKFPRGYYFIRIHTYEGMINRKIVLQ